MHRLKPLLWMLSCIVVAAHGAWGQAVTATLLGSVTDSSGAVVPNANVTVTEAATGVVRKASSTAEGVYTLPYLPPGVYRVDIETAGFKKFSRDNVELKIASATRVDAVLEPGSISETVEVKAESPLLQTDRAEWRAASLNRPSGNCRLPIATSRLWSAWSRG